MCKINMETYYTNQPDNIKKTRSTNNKKRKIIYYYTYKMSSVIPRLIGKNYTYTYTYIINKIF